MEFRLAFRIATSVANVVAIVYLLRTYRVRTIGTLLGWRAECTRRRLLFGAILVNGAAIGFATSLTLGGH